MFRGTVHVGLMLGSRDFRADFASVAVPQPCGSLAQSDQGLALE
jgi:hypothetical protein